MAREHRSVNWELQDLRPAISKEISFMETGTSTIDNREPEIHIPTASFFTGTRPKPNYNNNYRRNDRRRNGNFEKTFKKVCPFCKEEHSPNECSKVTSYESRIDIVKKEHLCFNCLRKHQVSSCRSTNRCRHCQRKHHSSICDKSAKQSTSTLNPNAASFMVTATSDAVNQPETSILHSTTQARHDVLLKTAVAQICSSSDSIVSNILFDEGAQRSFITEEMARHLHIKQTGSEVVHLASFGDTSQRVRHMSKGTVYLITDDNEKIGIDVLIVPKIAVPLRNISHNISTLPYLRGLKLAHPVTNDRDFEISLLIGADSYWKIVQDKVIRGNGPTAVQSRIGYLLSGPLPVSTHPASRFHQLPVTASTSQQPPVPTHDIPTHLLNVLTSPPDPCDIERFWKLESLGISEDEENIESTFLENYQRDSITYNNGRYTAKFPWKDDHAVLPTNYDITKKRTENVIRRLRQDPQILQKYGEIIMDQERRGFIEKIDANIPSQQQIHYIPHHGVKKDSITTPVRIVYDCSCRKSRDQPSLNDCLKSTPPELNDLTHILIRFRLHKYAVTTDIEKAFLQIQLAAEDRDVTRFLWLSDPKDPDSNLTAYRFKAVLFGATCSPFILSATLLKHLASNSDVWVSDILRRDLYVDNILSSFEDENQALAYFNDSRVLMSSANFNLRSWNSNSQELRNKALTYDVQDADKITKILGMRWNAETDMLQFQQTQIPVTDLTTKREILRQTSRLFDPLGLLSPVTVRAKIMLQQIWLEKFDWDTPLPADMQQRWESLVKDLNALSATQFSRCYFENPEADDKSPTTLHVFVDASQSSYGAAAYLCKSQQSSLIMAKNRVAPLKKLTLPRLELMAATIGARLLKHLQKTLTYTYFYLWSDSQIVLHWLETAKPLNRFVQNRVKEIKDLTGNQRWKYCPTSYNPADLLTRGITAIQFARNSLWQKGPSWINNLSSWPTWNPQEATVLTSSLNNTSGDEINTSGTDPSTSGAVATTVTPGIHQVIDIDRFSSYQKLLRVTAYVMRFINNSRNSNKRLEPLSSSELLRAEKAWLVDCQYSIYQAEIDNMRSSKSRSQLVKQLRLFIDDDGGIRCGGRIHNAPLAESSRFPYLLPSRHPLTRLIVLDCHQRLLHAGVDPTITYIRQKYWIPAIRQYVKTILRKCVTCRKVISKPYSPPDPPPLPRCRVEDTVPFTVTGVDFTGALYVRAKDGSESKAYICLFTCASTRAVHLEVVPDLTEESFLQAFRRFSSRKSLPHVMISDNASTFMAASNYITRLFESRHVQDTLTSQGTTWKFIPKRAPWYGGWWERLIGLTKTALKKTLGRAYVTFDSLQTVITEIEAVMNDRPLTYVSSGIYPELEPLTPAHLLYGRRITTLPYHDATDETDLSPSLGKHHNITQRARVQIKLIEDFRKRWRHDYLTAIREQHRTSGNNKQSISVGDVVQIHDDIPRAQWKLAVVEQLVPGRDGLVRSAQIRTDSGITNRPIVKLFPLEVTEL